MATELRTGVPNLSRGLARLEHPANDHRSATIAEVSERLGYPTASVFPIMQGIEQPGYLSRDPVNTRYSLTNILLLPGQPRGIKRGLVEVSPRPMRGLHKATRIGRSPSWGTRWIGPKGSEAFTALRLRYSIAKATRRGR